MAFSSNPNYQFCTDPDDAKQITDGLYSSGGNAQKVENTTAIWVQKGTVGWVRAYPVITIDLGKEQPISGLSYSTAAGISGVGWPEKIYLAVSDDNKSWQYLGDLTKLSQKNGLLPAKGYANFRFVTHDLQTKGRYVALGIVGNPYVFVDEIEVFGGDARWLNQPTGGKEIPVLTTFMQQSVVGTHVRNRLNNDIADLRQQLDKSEISADKKANFRTQLTVLEDATSQIETAPIDLKTILPLNETHRRILSLHGEMLAAQGFKPLTVWKQQRFAWLPLLVKPDTQKPAQLQFSMLGNQFRSDDVLLTNSGNTAMTVSIKLSDPPRGAQQNWLQVYSVEWTDTYSSLPVADALIPIIAQEDVYQFDVPAGMTRKVWCTIDSSKVLSGSYKSTFVVSGAGQQIMVPLNLNVAKLAMNAPRFSLGMWDYTNNGGSWGLHKQNIPDAIKLMRSHYVDTPWADPRVLHLRDSLPGDFDEAGNLIKEPDFTSLDQWITLWPGARNYFVFANVPNTFAGAKIGSPEFDIRAGNWAKALSTHIKELGLQPKQLGLLLLDEPREDGMDTTIVAWGKAIKAMAPDLTLFENPIWERPDQTKIQDAITQMDVLSPHLAVYKKGGEPVRQYFEKLRQSGKSIWIYQTSGSSRTLSPQLYYRYPAWQAFAMGATGQGFWSFGDSSGAPTSWQSYRMIGNGYEPAFLDIDTVYNSIHWDAVREGVEDYEELAMLRDEIQKSTNGTWKTQAQQVLNDAVEAVTISWNSDHDWTKETDPNLADAQLQKVRAILIQR